MDEQALIEAAAAKCIKDYLGVRAGERILLVSDSNTSPGIVEALAAAARDAGADPISVSFAPRPSSGSELPESVLRAAEAADVVVSVASRSPYHSSLKLRTQKAGARGVLNAPSKTHGWIGGAMHADFSQLLPLAARVRDALSTGSRVHVWSPAGTDVTMSIRGRRAVGWLVGLAREAGQTVAWPGGEVSIPPVEGSANGRVVFEVATTDVGELRTPIDIAVRHGFATVIEGGPEATRLRAHINGVANATNIGELGIGINPMARLSPDITESKKRLGTAHIALGDNANGYGGQVQSDVHLDGLVDRVTVEVDGVLIVDGGELRI